MENKWTIMPWSTRLAVLVMVIALFALMFIARKHPEQQQYTCDEWFNMYTYMVESNQIELERGASRLREEGCSDAALTLQKYWSTEDKSSLITDKDGNFIWGIGNDANKYTPMDDNLTNTKPTEWWRLNSNGYSQRYVQLYGDTKNERIISMLQSYGFEDAETEARPAIRTISRIFQVQPEIIVCIAYADSSLWRFLKTSYNYWNVGNNDRWDTQAFNNMEQGFYHIWEVLNNSLLGHYSTVNQLSRRGNPDGKIYASSPENWHINVMNCLGMIHNKYVPDTFNYRW